MQSRRPSQPGAPRDSPPRARLRQGGGLAARRRRDARRRSRSHRASLRLPILERARDVAEGVVHARRRVHVEEPYVEHLAADPEGRYAAPRRLRYAALELGALRRRRSRRSASGSRWRPARAARADRSRASGASSPSAKRAASDTRQCTMERRSTRFSSAVRKKDSRGSGRRAPLASAGSRRRSGGRSRRPRRSRARGRSGQVPVEARSEIARHHAPEALDDAALPGPTHQRRLRQQADDRQQQPRAASTGGRARLAPRGAAERRREVGELLPKLRATFDEAGAAEARRERGPRGRSPRRAAAGRGASGPSSREPRAPHSVRCPRRARRGGARPRALTPTIAPR